MLIINELKCEYQNRPICIDCDKPRFSYLLLSNKKNVIQDAYQIIVRNGDKIIWDSGKVLNSNSTNIRYSGESLEPYTEYNYTITCWCNSDEAVASSIFSTGKMKSKWVGKWITDNNVIYEENSSCRPVVFKKDFSSSKEIKRAIIYATCSGIYEIFVNGTMLGDRYFAPGFTSYNKNLSYQGYDCSTYLKKGNNVLNVVVGAGWAVGLFGFTTYNRNFTDKIGLLMELHLEYNDGSKKVIKSDTSFLVANESQYQYADFYMGEVYDSRITFSDLVYHHVSFFNPFPKATIKADYGIGVKKIKELKPVKMLITPKNEIVYDFGQNFAGVVEIKTWGHDGDVITVSHAEVLDCDGNFYTRNLRKAKAQYQYICYEGYQTFSPTLTYMGFRYCKVEGMANPDINSVIGFVLSSPLAEDGYFECSNEKLNRLQENIYWSSRSNLFDIPTDCPQRDERLGWTGDIAVFSRTATYNLDMKMFFDKWLVDLRADQLDNGAIGHIVPYVKCIPQTIPSAGWSDAAIFVPWASYLAYGDKLVLEDNYKCMKALVDCEANYAKIGCSGDEAYVFDKPFNFGDWLAPNEGNNEWMKKARELGTAYFANSSNIVSKVASILNKESDAIKYKKLFKRICKAYKNLFIDKTGELYNNYQSAYVCPMYFEMVDDDLKKKMASFLAMDVFKHDNHLTTGFLGTPFLLFALCDNGYEKTAYNLLLQETFPSWLYEVNAGATTIWERWDSLRPDGLVEDNGEDINNMVSFNHYAFGAVGDFLYRRVAGIEANELTPGYKHFTVKPVLGGNITYCKARHKTLYGTIEVAWQIKNQTFILDVTVPCNSTATIILPNGINCLAGSGKYHYTQELK